MKERKSICRSWLLKIKNINTPWKRLPKAPDQVTVRLKNTGKSPYGVFGTSAMSPEKRIKHLTHLLQSEQVLHSLARKHVKVLTYRHAGMVQILHALMEQGRLTEDEKKAVDLLFIDDEDT